MRRTTARLGYPSPCGFGDLVVGLNGDPLNDGPTNRRTDHGVGVQDLRIADPGPQTIDPGSGSEPDEASDRTASVDSAVTEVLEILLEAAEDHAQPTPVVELLERLPIPAGVVCEAIATLVAAGDASGDDSLRLTERGYERAAVAVRRHRLTERLLADVIGLEWWKVHHEAARWEGVLSDDVEERVLELLGDPGTCPHGNPIPGSANRPHHPAAVRLLDAPVGPVHVVRITETLEGDDEALQLLQSCGFVPGRDAEVKHVRQGWVEVAGTVHDAALPPHVAAHTYVAAL